MSNNAFNRKKSANSIDNYKKIVSPLVRKPSFIMMGVPALPPGESSNNSGESGPPERAVKSAAALCHPGMSSSQLAKVGNEVRQTIENSTIRPIRPARQYDVISLARAMNREQFAERVQEIFEPERDAALRAMQTGQYVTWRCADHDHDCQRIGMNGRCFCGHLLKEHREWDGHAIAVPCRVEGCACRAYSWVPSRPEEVGEFWLRRRRDFDPAQYRAKCKCKHTHEQHDPNGDHRCLVKGCPNRCSHFTSAFLCAACDRHWELHYTYFENEAMRRQEGRATGEDFLPFAEAPGLKRIVMGGEDRGFDTLEEAISDKYGPHRDAALTAGPRGAQHAIQSPARRPALPPPRQPEDKAYRGGNDDIFLRPW